MPEEEYTPVQLGKHVHKTPMPQASLLAGELATIVNSSRDLDQVLQTLAQRAIEFCDVDRCSLWQLEEASDSFYPHASYLASLPDQIKDEKWHQSMLPHSDPLIQRLSAEGGTLIIADLKTDPMARLLTETFRACSVLFILLTRQDQPLGLIALDSPGQIRPFSQEQVELARVCGQFMTIAIDNAYLLAKARKATELANERTYTLDAVFQAMSEGIIVFTSSGRVSIRNSAAASFLGMPVYSTEAIEVFLKQHPFYTVDGHPIPHAEFPMLRALAENGQVRGDRFLAIRSDGARRILEVTATPLRDSQKHQIGLVSAFRDVTVQTQAEQHIRQALETFLHVAEAVSHNTDISEILHSVLTRILTDLRCTRGIIHLFHQEKQIFEPLISLGFPPDEEARWLAEQQIWLAPQSEAGYSFYEELLNGQITQIDAEHCSVQPNPFGRTLILAAPIQQNQHILGLILLDYTPRTGALSTQHAPGFSRHDFPIIEGIAQLAGVAIEQAHWQQEAIAARTNEAAMRAADSMKDEFLAITAHEFRSPLAVILARSQGTLRSLRRNNNNPLTPATLEEHLQVIETQAKQLNNIVTTFLDAARMHQGNLTLKSEAVDLGQVARQIVEQRANLLENHTLRCIAKGTQGEQSSYMVSGDAARLSQIIANLIENAIKYSPAGGPITVTLRRRKGAGSQKTIEVSVDDKGIGIPPESQARLFERFYRVESLASKEARGLGLGLYIVSQLIHMHGGTIRVESSGIPGTGSRFIFSLPALAQSAVSNEPASTKG